MNELSKQKCGDKRILSKKKYIYLTQMSKNHFSGSFECAKVVDFDQELSLRVFIIPFLTNGMSWTDVHILTEELALCHKTIILSMSNNKLVSI